MSNNKKSRRQFLSSSSVALTAGWVALNMPLLLAAGETAQANLESGADYKNISAEQAVELSAFADQIIPPGETPGAVEAGVVYFMDAALGTFMAGTLPMIEAGLADWHQKAQTRNAEAKLFSQLTKSQQKDQLTAEENTPVFGLLHTMVLFGMFSSPSHGGNRDEAGWKLLGFDKRHVWSPPFGYYDAEAMGSTGYTGDNHV